jgi:arylsulfatase A
MHLNRTLCLALAFAFVSLSFQKTALSKTTSTRPNVILIYVDDMGYGDLGCYGSKVNVTPHIDKLATQGMRFTQYYSASSVCSPSRGALLTGCYPHIR